MSKSNIDITVSLHGVLRINKFKLEQRTYPANTRVEKVIDELQIPVKLLGIIIINGVHANATDILNNGDTLMLLPLLEGG